MSRRRTTLAAAVAFVAIALPANASGFPSPLPAKVTARGHTVNAEIGSYCVDSSKGNAGMCADKIFARPGRRHRLAVAPGMRMTFEFRDNPQLNDDVTDAAASLVRFHKDGRAEDVGELDLADAGDLWSLELPKRLHRANAINVFSSLDGGGDILSLIHI